MQIYSREKFLPQEEHSIHEGFIDYNISQGQQSERISMALAMYDGRGLFCAGLDGYFFFDYLNISRLWVRSDCRQQGLGKKLMDEAQDWALAREACGMTLSTYDFQARGFYEKMGFAVFGVLPNNPKGHQRYFMSKPLL